MHGYIPGWAKLRAEVLAAQPDCDCGAPATEAGHIIPRSFSGIDAWPNVIGQCSRCNRDLLAADRAAGGSVVVQLIRDADEVRPIDIERWSKLAAYAESIGIDVLQGRAPIPEGWGGPGHGHQDPPGVPGGPGQGSQGTAEDPAGAPGGPTRVVTVVRADQVEAAMTAGMVDQRDGQLVATGQEFLATPGGPPLPPVAPGHRDVLRIFLCTSPGALGMGLVRRGRLGDRGHAGALRGPVRPV
jgi:hypothetical protein